MKKTLKKARYTEQKALEENEKVSRPLFHLTPAIGWMNDPNGFSYYKGKYHLFYQSNPYNTQWADMHWSHVVSSDLLTWEYLPTALAPDQEYDKDGCFSGTAIVHEGKHYLFYTGVNESKEDASTYQTQCLAVGDGINYKKVEENPVIDSTDLPKNMSTEDFRDPKVWEESENLFKCIVAARKNDGNGAILQYKSSDCINWEFDSILLENDGSFGDFWECPDIFKLDDKDILIVSPMNMQAKGLEYRNGHEVVCFVGRLNDSKDKFKIEANQALDHGIDFYAPQTLLSPDGRRILIAWMQNWNSVSEGNGLNAWYGQMCIPRELSYKNNHIYQKPIKELDKYRQNPIEVSERLTNEAAEFRGVSGRRIDMEIDFNFHNDFENFCINFAADNKYASKLNYNAYDSILELDRRHSGSKEYNVHLAQTKVKTIDDQLRLRIILDNNSVEVFINGGEKVMSAAIWTPTNAEKINFSVKGTTDIKIRKFDLIK